jgi:hypothetical protein
MNRRTHPYALGGWGAIFSGSWAPFGDTLPFASRGPERHARRERNAAERSNATETRHHDRTVRTRYR